MSRSASAVRCLGGLLAAVLGCACSPLSPYESSAAELAKPARGAGAVEFSTEWRPQGRDSSTELSAEERVQGRFWLDSCVSELSARFMPAPKGAVRALQIAECMEARGWHLFVREVKQP